MAIGMEYTMNIIATKSTAIRRILAVMLATIMALFLSMGLSFIRANNAYAASSAPNLTIIGATQYNTFLHPGESTILTVVPADVNYLPDGVGLSYLQDGFDFTWTSSNAAVTVGSPYGVSVSSGGSTYYAAAAEVTVAQNTTYGGPVNIHITNNTANAPSTAQIDLTIVIEPTSPASAITVQVRVSALDTYTELGDNYSAENPAVRSIVPASASNVLTGATGVAQNYHTPESALVQDIQNPLVSPDDYNRYIAAIDWPANSYAYVNGISLYDEDENQIDIPAGTGAANYGWLYRVYDSTGVMRTDFDASLYGASIYPLNAGDIIYWQYGPYGITFPSTVTP
jgi:hypothetical protein